MSPKRANAESVARAAERQRALIIDMLIGDPWVWRYISEQAREMWPQLPVDSDERRIFADLDALGQRIADLGDKAAATGKAAS